MALDIIEILSQAVADGCSDVFLVPGLPASYKTRGEILRMDAPPLTAVDAESLISQIYELADGRGMEQLTGCGEDDFSFGLPTAARFRTNVFRQRGMLSAVLRAVPFALPDRERLGIPQSVIELAYRRRGLVLVTGPAGSGKSTTLATIVDEINTNLNRHIITIEDPIEYMHPHKKSIVTQRELEADTASYSTALRAALREAPDVILLGEMRDHESISAAVTAAETGHLVLSTLHTLGAANTLDRIIDSFTADQQPQIRSQLSMVLQGIVSQQLVPAANGGSVAAFEVLLANTAVRNLVRERNTHQIDSVIQTSAAEGMITMDNCLANLVQQKKITVDTALSRAYNREQMERKLGGRRDISYGRPAPKDRRRF